ncbi:MAG TPA: methionyl-tRNA formyltransferase [Ilumatobacter sp.]
MRLVYLGTPAIAVPPLEALVAAGHHVALVVTGADKRRGRGNETSPSPVKQAATRLGIPVSHVVDDVLGVGAELGVVVAFGRLIKPHVLAELRMVNLHFSLLPRWRGAAPVERAVLAGDTVTGVCVMAVEEGLDTGGVYARVEVPIGPATTLDELRDELVQVGTQLLVDTLEAGLGEPVPQDGEPTYARKIDPAELRIDWSLPAAAIDRLVRLGGAWTTFRGGRVKINAARLDDGELVPTVVQPEGKRPMSYAAWRNGARPGAGERFE